MVIKLAGSPAGVEGANAPQFFILNSTFFINPKITPMENQNTNPVNAADMATFLGYEDVPLSRPIGDRKSVKVKCLPVRAFAEYAALFALESELVEFATDLSRDEVDMLLPDDSGKIFEKVHELNRVPFTGWLRRKAAATKLQAQILGASLPKEENPTGE